MKKCGAIVMPRDFKKALYYAVREDSNQRVSPGHIDKRWDSLIRAAVKFFETRTEGQLPEMCIVEIDSLANAAIRRGIYRTFESGHTSG